MANNFTDAVKAMHARMNTAMVVNKSPSLTPDYVAQQVKRGQKELLDALRTNPNLLKKQTGIVKK